MRQLIFIHGGDAFETEEDYVLNLQTAEVSNPFEQEKRKKWKDALPELLADTHACVFLRMPCADNARYDIWKLWFERHKPFFEDGIVLIGHSLGGNFLAKFLAEEDIGVSVAQLHLIAPSFAAVHFELPKQLARIEKQCEHIYIYHSKNDTIVDYKHALEYQAALPSAELLTFENRGHFLQEEFPELVDKIKSL